MHFSNKKGPHIVTLSKPNWFNPDTVTTIKIILLFKVRTFEHELQKESNVLCVMKRRSSSLFQMFFLKYLAKTGVTISSHK